MSEQTFFGRKIGELSSDTPSVETEVEYTRLHPLVLEKNIDGLDPIEKTLVTMVSNSDLRDSKNKFVKKHAAGRRWFYDLTFKAAMLHEPARFAESLENVKRLLAKK